MMAKQAKGKQQKRQVLFASKKNVDVPVFGCFCFRCFNSEASLQKPVSDGMQAAWVLVVVCCC